MVNTTEDRVRTVLVDLDERIEQDKQKPQAGELPVIDPGYPKEGSTPSNSIFPEKVRLGTKLWGCTLWGICYKAKETG